MSIIQTMRSAIVKVTGARGPSFADVARRVGAIAGIAVPRDASDELVLNLLSQGLTDAVAAAGYTVIEPARAAATGNVNVANPGTAIFDGVTLTSGQRLFLPLQTNKAQNGIYTFNGSGSALTRVSDFDQTSEVVTGALVNVTEGENKRGSWVLVTTGSITVGTTDQVWRPFTIRDITRADLQAQDGSAIVTYTPNGTGAVARTVQARLRDYVSVKDFGAIGDGVTDDTAAIQAALDYCIANSGYNLYYPRGAYLVTSSLDCTYAGTPSGLGSGYYGFTVEGEDKFNTYIVGQCADEPILDLTGKSRMTFRNIGFANYTNNANNPSCALLLARNLTNNFAGGHLFDNVNIRGYFTEIAVQTASSEVNVWINCSIEPFSEVPSFALTDQITTGVNSSYINLSGHVFSGGNTRHVFVGCIFNALYGGATNDILLAAVDNATFVGCYTKCIGNATFKVLSNSQNVKFIDLRDESQGAYFMQIDAGATISGFEFTGRAARSIRGEDTSVITKSNISPNFIATASTYSLDAYDCTETDVRGMTNNVRVRNNAYKSRFWDYKPAAEWVLPTATKTCPEFYWLSYTGGSANYSRKIMSSDPFRRDEFGRIKTTALVLPETLVSGATGSYAPDYSTACCFAFDVVGGLTVANPTNVNLGPSDGYGQILILNFRQNNIGGNAVSFGSSFDLGGATVSTAANAYTSFMFSFSALGGGKWVRVR